MKEEIRRAVAHAVVANSGGTPQTFIYRWSERRHTPFDGAGPGGFDHAAGAHVEETELGLFHHLDGGCHVKLEVTPNSFKGFDYASNGAFWGTVSGSDVQLYDKELDKFFRYTA
jgi:hypothetical protein